MIDLKIKITGLSVYNEETPLELGFEDAKKLYEELGKVFERPRLSQAFNPWHPAAGETTYNVSTESVDESGRRFKYMCSGCAGNNVVPL